MKSTRKVFIPRIAISCLILGVVACFLVPGPAAANPRSELEKFWTDSYGNRALLEFDNNSIYGFKRKVLAKAQPDECFQGVGNPDNAGNPYDWLSSPPLSFYKNYPGGLTEDQQATCREIPINAQYEAPGSFAQPKTNQAYVWGLTKFGNKLWFGTIPNTHCLVISGYLGVSEASLTDSYVCEGGEADFRPPRAFYYDISKKKLVDVTQRILVGGALDRYRLTTTIGLRSAGAKAQVAFLGGINTSGGINIFAFNAKTGEYLGSKQWDNYNNIRQWRLINDELYVGVANRIGGGGEILRWTGKLGGDIWSFERIGQVDGDPAYLTYHDGRIFVSTWPNFMSISSGGVPMSIYMSPLLGIDGMGTLTADDDSPWDNVWRIDDYEPEASVVGSAGGGPLMSYQGYLYWGTMHVPGLSLVLWNAINPGDSDENAMAAVLGSYRAISIFRGKDFGTETQQVELLYGNAYLPKYTSSDGWQIVPNNMGQTPKYGLAGFNNFLNNYTWWMEVFQNELFVGTMDFSYLIGSMIETEYDFPEAIVNTAKNFFGADLYRFTSSDQPAIPVSINGVGNYTNYGVRTMVSTDDALYIGTANPMNLMTDTTDDKPEGGWELLKLTK